MKLIDLEIFPNGNEGWGSGRLKFSSYITQLFGSNGAGKTPIVKSLSYALGNDCEFRDEIYLKCKCVRLRIEVDGETYQLSRAYSKRFFLEILKPDGETIAFNNEGKFSEYFLTLIGLTSPSLVSSSGEEVKAYMTCLLPLFYAEQNDGYSRFYRAKGSFVKDQMAEMIRLSVGLAPKNSFSRVRDRNLAKEKVELSIADCVRTQRQYEKLLERIDIPYTTVDDVKEKIDTLNSQLSELEVSSSNSSDAINLIDEDIRETKKLVSKLSGEVEEIQRFIDSNKQVVDEIESELDTLSLNEEAKRVFMSFDEVCSLEGCGMFLKSSEAYAKNLIYLKDQIKDIELISGNAEKELARKKQLYFSALDKLHELRLLRDAEHNKTPIDSKLDTVRRLTREVVKSEYELALLEEKENIEQSLVEKEYRKLSAEEYLESLEKKSTSDTSGVIKFKARLQKLLSVWISRLNTVNVPKIVEVQSDFTAKFGGESLIKFDGSTRLRIVLAYHAALIQAIAESNPSGLRFLVLDTPAQHNIDTEDLDEYLKSLRDLATKRNVQVIFSTTKYRYDEQDGDITWEASYKGFEQLMYLGKPS